jgi:hypothetical protein
MADRNPENMADDDEGDPVLIFSDVLEKVNEILQAHGFLSNFVFRGRCSAPAKEMWFVGMKDSHHVANYSTLPPIWLFCKQILPYPNEKV